MGDARVAIGGSQNDVLRSSNRVRLGQTSPTPWSDKIPTTFSSLFDLSFVRRTGTIIVHMSGRIAKPIRGQSREMKDIEKSGLPPAETPGPRGRNYLLQNKLLAVRRYIEPLRKKPLFAKQTAGGRSFHRIHAEKTTSCKTNACHHQSK